VLNAATYRFLGEHEYTSESLVSTIAGALSNTSDTLQPARFGMQTRVERTREGILRKFQRTSSTRISRSISPAVSSSADGDGGDGLEFTTESEVNFWPTGPDNASIDGIEILA
jgi:hypothetical protein